jgi:hypothetical protein
MYRQAEKLPVKLRQHLTEIPIATKLKENPRQLEFDDTTDYCLRPRVRVSFQRAVPTIEEFINHVTRSAESEGVMSETSELAPCEVELPDYAFNQGYRYCYTVCPAFVIGGIASQDKCIIQARCANLRTCTKK